MENPTADLVPPLAQSVDGNGNSSYQTTYPQTWSYETWDALISANDTTGKTGEVFLNSIRAYIDDSYV